MADKMALEQNLMRRREPHRLQREGKGAPCEQRVSTGARNGSVLLKSKPVRMRGWSQEECAQD